MLAARAIISKLMFVLYMGVSSVLLYLRVTYFCWLSSASVSYHFCVAVLHYLHWNTVFYEDQSVFGIVCCHYNVIEFSDRPLLFYKIQFYPAISHSSVFHSFLWLFLLSSHSLMWVINEALVGRPSSPYVSGVSRQHVSHTLSVSHSVIHTLVVAF